MLFPNSETNSNSLLLFANKNSRPFNGFMMSLTVVVMKKARIMPITNCYFLQEP